MIQWTEALSTGVSLLDEHHRAIFQWLAELERAAVDERRLFGAYAVTRLSHYVREHFTVEEALMKSVGYPGLADHLAEHAVFRAKLRELQTESVGHDISHDAVKFLSDWLCDHITRVDMAYVPYLKR
jgi:hemerythrin